MTNETTDTTPDFRQGETLVLEPLPNGGWTIGSDEAVANQFGTCMYGAYTNSDDMIKALARLITS